jgi:hypothetical protein
LIGSSVTKGESISDIACDEYVSVATNGLNVFGSCDAAKTKIPPYLPASQFAISTPLGNGKFPRSIFGGFVQAHIDNTNAHNSAFAMCRKIVETTIILLYRQF